MKKFSSLLAGLALAAPMLASASQGYVVADISLQAGPDEAYPSIDMLYAGTPVSIQGCLSGWTWCDVVAAGGDRGWVPGTFLEETYGGRRVVIIDYGPRIGIPVVSFSLGLYWDRYYHNRPFYTQRREWQTRHIAVRAPSRPSMTIAQPTESHPATQPQRDSVQRATTSERETTVAKARRAPQPSSPTPQSKPETAPQPIRPSDAPPQAKPEQQPEPHDAKPPVQTAATHKAEPRAHEPKPKDELRKDERGHNGKGKKDDDGGG